MRKNDLDYLSERAHHLREQATSKVVANLHLAMQYANNGESVDAFLALEEACVEAAILTKKLDRVRYGLVRRDEIEEEKDND